MPGREKRLSQPGIFTLQQIYVRRNALQQCVLQNIKELHVALLESEPQVFVRAVRVVDQDFNLDIFLDTFLQDILQEGKYVRMVGAEAAPRAFCFQQVFRIQIHRNDFLSVCNRIKFLPQVQEGGELRTHRCNAIGVDFRQKDLFFFICGS